MIRRTRLSMFLQCSGRRNIFLYSQETAFAGTGVPRTSDPPNGRESAVGTQSRRPFNQTPNDAAARGLILWRHARYCSGRPIRSSRAAKEPVLCRRGGPYARTGALAQTPRSSASSTRFSSGRFPMPRRSSWRCSGRKCPRKASVRGDPRTEMSRSGGATARPLPTSRSSIPSGRRSLPRRDGTGSRGEGVAELLFAARRAARVRPHVLSRGSRRTAARRRHQPRFLAERGFTERATRSVDRS